MAQPEHNLQTQACKFARDCITAKHKIWASDRSKKQTPMQHIRERARGLIPGVADLQLAVIGLPEIFLEAKWGSNKPSEAQLRFAADVEELGRLWYWFNSVEMFRQCLVAAGVEMRNSAVLVAAHLDALLKNAELRRQTAGPKKINNAPRKAPASPAGLKAMHRSYWGKK
jgi:hypothetical protein